MLFSISGPAEVKMKQALLVIDVQNEYFTGKMPVSYPPKSLDNILKAMDTATGVRTYGWTVWG